jgi:hypothetical protein
MKQRPAPQLEVLVPAVDPMAIAGYQCARALGRPAPANEYERDRAIHDFVHSPTTAVDTAWSGWANTTLRELGTEIT